MTEPNSTGPPNRRAIGARSAATQPGIRQSSTSSHHRFSTRVGEHPPSMPLITPASSTNRNRRRHHTSVTEKGTDKLKLRILYSAEEDVRFARCANAAFAVLTHDVDACRRIKNQEFAGNSENNCPARTCYGWSYAVFPKGNVPARVYDLRR
ncbi:hypothetical protein KIN20_029385 [Parelaphostrongylus tenuis]|uniref:Uncharacterized protein n=1 Tax=Parelaphostrongylus tenuis TaxID=148309 RepID=A0AAD5WFL0_PARTN|nr:hypothetical protein KIN20_029385 [Parelaphostrongylus tenuis]